MSERKDKLRRLIQNCREVEIDGGSVYLPQQVPARLAEIVLEFLAKDSD